MLKILLTIINSKQKLQMSYQYGGSQVGTEVYLNIYDLEPNANQVCSTLGLGFYHTGIWIGLN